MYELNNQQIENVNGGGILTGMLLGLAYNAIAGACRPCVPVAPCYPVAPPTSR